MSEQPLVSIVIPTHNRAGKLEKAINSIWSQTYTNYEVIVSDDGSTDNTSEVVFLLSMTKPINYISSKVNRGAQFARNQGIKAAKGEWIAFLDSDDEWLPESLKLRMDLALKGSYTVVYSNAYIIHEDNTQQLYQFKDVSKDSYRGVLSGEGPMFQSLLVKKEAIEKIGYLDESAIAYQEWNTSIRLAKYFKFGFINVPTFIYDYRTPGAISRSHARNAKAYADIVHKFFGEMITHIGARGLGYHYELISQWYQKAGDHKKRNFYKILSIVFKVFSPRIITTKLSQLFKR